ncbi:helix-turn-helix domain-containing protein [Pedobacter nyackensis]|uniref:Helix-turn-helix domain-containing protein n=1 Tax=Pedobacter nyackensis TaxID=475255 RepID=A0A1W2AAQ7_9SPHI|nr:helix-turn-helix domain-containing protein [Pedobacter nyackensis]SMC57673.1 Helix-turn-helix domain-containing protein [Pedobacter nyackensis]
MLHLIGIIISLFLSVILFTKKGKSQADVILSVWLFFIGAHLSVFYIHLTGQYVKFPYFLGFEIPLPLIHGPFLYLYTRSLTSQNNRREHWAIHFVPLIMAAGLLYRFFILSYDKKIGVYINSGAGFENVMRWIYLATLLSGVMYVILSLSLLRKYAAYIANQFSDLERINLNWLRYLILGIGITWISVFFANDILTFTIIDLFILFLGYFGVKQVGVFTNRNITNQTINEKIDEAAVANATEKIKYQKSPADETLLLKIHHDLEVLMQGEKLYKDPDLNLDELAQRLNVNANILSQVINAIENKNFFDYINEQRIAEFIEISVLPENRKFTFLALAYEVGFNSKTSFNRNFKSITGQTPTMYLKEQKIQLK